MKNSEIEKESKRQAPYTYVTCSPPHERFSNEWAAEVQQWATSNSGMLAEYDALQNYNKSMTFLRGLNERAQYEFCEPLVKN